MSEKIAEVVDGFGQMDARQQTIHCWTVTSWRNDSTTAHEVNLRERTCTCEDQTMNNQGEEVCAHIMKAAHQARGQLEVGDALAHDLTRQMQELEGHVRAIERRATGIAADAEAGGSAGGSGGGDSDDSGGVDDPLAAMRSLLESEGLDPDDFELWIDDEYGSLQMDQDGYLDDDEFQALQDFKDDHNLQWDPTGEVNYLKADDFEEVLG